MPLALRHRDDPIQEPTPLPGLVVTRVTDVGAMARLQGRHEEEMARRFAAGHRAYVAILEGVPAAWGWVATRTAEIGELGATFDIPAGERYLWNFVTLPSHRGLGIYPRLLTSILKTESAEAERFWIAYAPENHASGAGIRKAGFTAVAELSFDRSGKPAVKALLAGGALVVAPLLGLPVADNVAPCWRCVRTKRHVDHFCPDGRCACDYQHPVSGCAA